MNIETITNIVADTIDEMGDEGAPSGVIYAALLTLITLEQYEELIGRLVEAGRIRQVGDVLFSMSSGVGK